MTDHKTTKTDSSDPAALASDTATVATEVSFLIPYPHGIIEDLSNEKREEREKTMQEHRTRVARMVMEATGGRVVAVDTNCEASNKLVIHHAPSDLDKILEDTRRILSIPTPRALKTSEGKNGIDPVRLVEERGTIIVCKATTIKSGGISIDLDRNAELTAIGFDGEKITFKIPRANNIRIEIPLEELGSEVFIQIGENLMRPTVERNDKENPAFQNLKVLKSLITLLEEYEKISDGLSKRIEELKQKLLPTYRAETSTKDPIDPSAGISDLTLNALINLRSGAKHLVDEIHRKTAHALNAAMAETMEGKKTTPPDVIYPAKIQGEEDLSNRYQILQNIAIILTEFSARTTAKDRLAGEIITLNAQTMEALQRMNSADDKVQKALEDLDALQEKINIIISKINPGRLSLIQG